MFSKFLKFAKHKQIFASYLLRGVVETLKNKYNKKK